MKTLIKLDGLRCRNKMEFFKAINEQLAFPEYFGHNWDSFEECMNDVAQGFNEQITIFITDYEDFLSERKQDKKIFKSTARELYSRGAIIFYKSKVL